MLFRFYCMGPKFYVLVYFLIVVFLSLSLSLPSLVFYLKLLFFLDFYSYDFSFQKFE